MIDCVENFSQKAQGGRNPEDGQVCLHPLGFIKNRAPGLLSPGGSVWFVNELLPVLRSH